MREKHGVVAVIFDEKEGRRYFLLLHRVLNWSGWEFCKGGIDAGENPEQAIYREIDEETGLTKLVLINTLPRKMAWIAKDTKYLYTPFILRGDMSEPVDLVQEIIEHDDHKWVAQEEVEKTLRHDDNKKLFREAIALMDSK